MVFNDLEVYFIQFLSVIFIGLFCFSNLLTINKKGIRLISILVAVVAVVVMLNLRVVYFGQFVKLIGTTKYLGIVLFILFIIGLFVNQKEKLKIPYLLIAGFNVLISIVAIGAQNMIVLFVSLQLLSTISYCTVAIMVNKNRRLLVVKELLLSWSVEFFLLIGLFMFFLGTDSMSIADIQVIDQFKFIISIIFMFVYMVFKMGAFPFCNKISYLELLLGSDKFIFFYVIPLVVITFKFVYMLNVFKGHLILENSLFVDYMVMTTAGVVAIYNAFSILAVSSPVRQLLYLIGFHSSLAIVFILFGNNIYSSKQLLYNILSYIIPIMIVWLVFSNYDSTDIKRKKIEFSSRIVGFVLIVSMSSLFIVPAFPGFYSKMFVIRSLLSEGHGIILFLLMIPFCILMYGIFKNVHYYMSGSGIINYTTSNFVARDFIIVLVSSCLIFMGILPFALF